MKLHECQNHLLFNSIRGSRKTYNSFGVFMLNYFVTSCYVQTIEHNVKKKMDGIYKGSSFPIKTIKKSRVKYCVIIELIKYKEIYFLCLPGLCYL